MKNFKKVVLGIGTLATTITPIITIISCSSEDEGGATPPTGPGVNPDIVNSVFASEDALIEALRNDNINGILDSIKTINYEVIKAFLKTVTVEKTKVLLELLVEKITENDLSFVDIDKQENIDKIASVFDLFKKDLPEIASIDSQEFAIAVVDLLSNGIDIKEGSVDILISFAKVLFPSNLEVIDAIGSVIKTITTKSVADVPPSNLKLIFDLIKPLFVTDSNSNLLDFIGKLLGSNVLKGLLGHMVDETDENGYPIYVRDENGQDTTIVKQKQVGYENFDDFEADLRSILPESWLKMGYYVEADIVSFDSLMQDIKTKDYPVYGAVITGATVTYALNELIANGLKPGSVSNILQAIVEIDFWDLIKGYLPAGVGDIIDELQIEDYYPMEIKIPDSYRDSGDGLFARFLIKNSNLFPGNISTTIYNILKNPLTSLTAYDFENIIKVINIVAGKNIPLDAGDAIYEVVHNLFSSPLGSISVVLDLIKELKPSWSSMIDVFETIIPTLFIGADKVKSEEVEINAEFTKLKSGLTESKVTDGSVLPEGFDEDTYPNLLAWFNEYAKHIENYDPMRARYYLTKIEAIKVEMDNYNAAIDALNAARVDFAAKYGSSHEVVPMNTITAADPKHLDKAYEAVSAKLVLLYNLDLDNSKLEVINNAKKQIETLEGVIGEVNLAIDSLNGDATFDTGPLLDKIASLKILVEGLSPIDKAIFDAFELEFNAAEDVKRLNGEKPYWSIKSGVLAKFIDDNALKLFGDTWTMPNLVEAFGNLQWKFDSTYELTVKDHYSGKLFSKEHPGDAFDVESFVNNILKTSLSTEDFIKLQYIVLNWLTY